MTHHCQCELLVDRGGSDNFRKQTLEGERSKRQERRLNNASGFTSCSTPESGQRHRLRAGLAGEAAMWWGAAEGPRVVNVFSALPGWGDLSVARVNFTRPLQTILRKELLLCPFQRW